MHRIDGPTATENNLFTEGNPQAGIAPTRVKSAWLNAVQEELAAAIEAAGLELDPAESNQLLAALLAHIGKWPAGDVQAALTAAAGGGRVIVPAAAITPEEVIAWPAGTVGVQLEGLGGADAANKGSRITYAGDPIEDGALLKASSAAGFANNAVRDVSLSADGKLRYVLHFDTWSAGTFANKKWSVERVELVAPTLAHVLMGQDTWAWVDDDDHSLGGDYTAATQDADVHLNVFDKAQFYCRAGVKYGIVENVADNAYQLTVRDSAWEGNAAQRADILNYLRVVRGNDARVFNCYFPPISDRDTADVIKDDVACIRQQSGALVVYATITEEARVLIRGPGISSPNGSTTLMDVSVNDSRDNDDGSHKLAIDDTGGVPLVLSNCKFGTAANPRRIKSNSPVFAQGVDIGATGNWELEKSTQCVVDGVRIGSMPALHDNWNLSDWIDAATLNGWRLFVGSGGAASLAQTATDAAAGPSAAEIDISVAANAFGVGIYGQFDDPMYHTAQGVTVAIRGTLEVADMAPKIYITDGQTTALGNTTFRVNPVAAPSGFYPFWAVAHGNPAAAFQVIAGVSVNVTGKLRITSCVVAPIDGAPAPANAAAILRYAATLPDRKPHWNSMTLLNSYANAAGTAAFARSVQGRVYLRGAVTGGGAGQAICSLPASCRPAVEMKLPVVANGAAGILTVQAGGDVINDSASGTNVYFDTSFSLT